MTEEPLSLELEDAEWPFEYIDHDRPIARAIVIDAHAYFYFLRVQRTDVFGNAVTIETSGGGIEPGETPTEAVMREAERLMREKKEERLRFSARLAWSAIAIIGFTAIISITTTCARRFRSARRI